MFEKELAEKFGKIFNIDKVTYNEPGESQEQGCLFIDIDSCNSTIKDGKAVALIEGNAYMYAPSDKLPFGFFAKCIRKADTALTKDLFFFNIENNNQRFQNIIQRGFSFKYFYRGQFDPEIGTITSITILIEESLE